YLAVEQIRFGERLGVELNVVDAAKEMAVPPLILQPLVENAVRHGIAHRLEGGTVSIAARVDGPELWLSVSNPCDPDRPRRQTPTGTGVGLLNVRRRLDAAWGGKASVEVRSAAERFHVELRLPAAPILKT
ncbi:MAG: ATP-binding protein, partial [Acidobacteriota bacterium]